MSGLANTCKGTIDLDTDTIKLMLTDARGTHTPWIPSSTLQGSTLYRDVLAYHDAVVTGGGTGGYTADGWTVATKTLSTATTPDLSVNWDHADLAQGIGGTLAFRCGVWYKSRGGAASADEVIGFVDWGTQTVQNATLNITATNPLNITAGTYT